MVTLHHPPQAGTQMNDWQNIEAHLRAEFVNRPDTARQIWSWSGEFRSWLDARGTDARVVEAGDIAAFLDHEVWGPGSSNRDQRVWALRAVVLAARSFAPSRARGPQFATAWLDTVPPRSPLGNAIARVLARAKSEGDRRRWSTAMGMFARWCGSRGLKVDDAWPGDVDAFGRDYRASGKTSPGEYQRVARLLLRELNRDSA